MQELAQELVDLVIDEVAATVNTQDIGSCSRVCRRWLPRSRKHLFQRITLSHAALLEILDLMDASPAPLLPFVRSLNIHEPFTEAHVVQLQSCSALTELCIRAPHSTIQAEQLPEQLRFQRWLQNHIPCFGAACLALTRFELDFSSDIPLRIIADIITSLPRLTHLRLCGDKYAAGIVSSEPVLPTDVFPPHLHTLDVSLKQGTSLLFEWLLAHRQPPIFTSLTIRGSANGVPTAPIDIYFELVGPKIESLSLAYWADADPYSLTASNSEQTHIFETHVLAFTSRLVHLTLVSQYAFTIPATLKLLPSVRLTTITIGVRSSTVDWPLIDAIVATPRFASLQRLSFELQRDKKSLLTAEVKVLMPQANARNILH
ncbi:hypothetical protein FB451DRAFT_1268457 [Mycena latifolia]|nr:hypothetical protein FB451DRAFT_1268457 [Mycena latifolia]